MNILCILDGWGISSQVENNAIALANTPNWDKIKDHCHLSLLQASGVSVGLPAGQMGNSEVGHMHMGSGRLIKQGLSMIDHAIASGDFYKKKALQDFIAGLQQTDHPCHLMGLLSDGGIHSHQNHIEVVAELMNKNNITTYIHAFTDGRDTHPQSAEKYIKRLLDKIAHLPFVQLATISGRYYAMDRDNRWDRTKCAYDTIVCGLGDNFSCPLEYIKKCYTQNVYDEFIAPASFANYRGISKDDGILMANYRSDRVRQLLNSLSSDDFVAFPTHFIAENILGMVNYATKFKGKVKSIFADNKISNTLGEVLAHNDLPQMRFAETEKYAHVTYFFNGGVEEPFTNEDRIMIQSPKVKTYDLCPEMSAYELTDRLCHCIAYGKHDLIVVNYANADMVGHTGNLSAAISAVECIDRCLKGIVDAVNRVNGNLLITADHGNIEVMHSKDGVCTSHTSNPVPFLIYNGKIRYRLRGSGGLIDIAPTVLDLMNIPVPIEMTGRSLIIR